MLSGALVGTLLASVTYGPPEVVATFSVAGLAESSGLAVSRRQSGVVWTHNDSGNAPVLFALTLDGKLAGRWTLRGARMVDWEALAIGPGPVKGADYLYIGDIGDNLSRRQAIVVYRVREPDVRAKGRTAAATPLEFRYPDGPHDSEALAIHPHTGDLYFVTKARGLDPQTVIYKASAPFRTGSTIPLKRIAAADLDLSLVSMVVGLVTGATIAPDGRRVALCSYTKAWEATLPADSPATFDDIWKGPWKSLDAGDRPRGEAIAYTGDGRALLLSSEGSQFDLVRLPGR